jgi:hypothetical protein
MKIKRDLPFYVLAGAIAFLGMSISGSQASAAPAYVKASDFNRLQMQFNQFKQCVNQNFTNIYFFDASRSSKISFINQCY